MQAYLTVPDAASADGLSAAADALVFDPQDAAGLAELRARPGRPRLLARLGPLDAAGFAARLDAAVAARPDACVLPIARAAEIADLGARLAVAEAEHGLPDGGIGIVALVARSSGILDAGRLAGASPRLSALGWDAPALGAELGAGMPWAGGGWIPPLAQARALVRLAAAAAGVPAIEAAYPGADAEGCRAAAEAARRDGFAGMLARDPAQAACIRAVG